MDPIQGKAIQRDQRLLAVLPCRYKPKVTQNRIVDFCGNRLVGLHIQTVLRPRNSRRRHRILCLGRRRLLTWSRCRSARHWLLSWWRRRNCHQTAKSNQIASTVHWLAGRSEMQHALSLFKYVATHIRASRNPHFVECGRGAGSHIVGSGVIDPKGSAAAL